MDYWAFETYWFYNIPDDGRIQPMGTLNDSRANSGKINEGQSARQAVVQTPIPPVTLKKIKALKASGLSLRAIAKQTGSAWVGVMLLRTEALYVPYTGCVLRGSPVNLQTLETDPDNPCSPIDLILINLAIGIVFIKRTMSSNVPAHLTLALVIPTTPTVLPLHLAVPHSTLTKGHVPAVSRLFVILIEVQATFSYYR